MQATSRQQEVNIHNVFFSSTKAPEYNKVIKS
jgi:hypothetical protein